MLAGHPSFYTIMYCTKVTSVVRLGVTRRNYGCIGTKSLSEEQRPFSVPYVLFSRDMVSELEVCGGFLFEVQKYREGIPQCMDPLVSNKCGGQLAPHCSEVTLLHAVQRICYTQCTTMAFPTSISL